MKLSYTRFNLFNHLKKIFVRRRLSVVKVFKYLPYWIKGFDTEQIRLFDLVNNPSTNYFPNAYAHRLSLNTNVGYWPIMHDKLFFHLFFRGKLKMAKLYFIVSKGSFVTIDEACDAKKLLELLKNTRLVLKPLQGGRGSGILFSNYQNSKITLNDKIYEEDEVVDFIRSLDNYGVYERLVQHDELNRVFDQTSNTIRLNTIRTANGLKMFGVLRIGNRRSIPFDNFMGGRGGLAAKVDQETGTVIETLYLDDDGNAIRPEKHPDSHEQIVGMTIPFWNELRTDMQKTMDENPMFDLVGWDILIGKDGYYVLEGNHNPTFSVTQVFFPILQDPDRRQFFKDHNLIR